MHHARERVVGVRLGRLGLASARLVRTAPIAAVQHAGTGKDKCMSGRHPGARRGPPALAVCVHMCGSCFGGGCRAHYRQTPSSSESYHAGDGPSGRQSDASRHSWRSLDLRSLARGRLVSRRPRSGLWWRAAADAHGGVPRGRWGPVERAFWAFWRVTSPAEAMGAAVKSRTTTPAGLQPRHRASLSASRSLTRFLLGRSFDNTRANFEVAYTLGVSTSHLLQVTSPAIRA